MRQLETEDSMSSAKFVDVRLKFICDIAKRDILRPEYDESRLMMADICLSPYRRPEWRSRGSLSA